MLFTLGSAKTLHILEKVTAQPTAAGIGLPIYMKASNSPPIDQPKVHQKLSKHSPKVHKKLTKN